MVDDFKASFNFDKRTVFVSLGVGGRGSLIGPRIKKRLKLAQPRLIEVLEHKPGESRLEFIQRVEEVADLVVLVDDETCEALNLAPPEPGPGEELVDGQELVVALRRNEKAAHTQLPQVRIWLARVDGLDLAALSGIGRGRWDLSCEAMRRRLHWLYEPDERVTHDKVDNGLFSDADDERLGLRIKVFRDHQLDRCPPCGGMGHAAARP